MPQWPLEQTHLSKCYMEENNNLLDSHYFPGFGSYFYNLDIEDVNPLQAP